MLFDRLPADQQELLRDLTKDPEFYGVLVPPPGSQRKTKSACQSTALLLFTLMEPGPIPAFVQTSLGERANQAIAEMVLDEVLMIEHDGGFVCGSAAYDLLYSEPHVEEIAAVPRRLDGLPQCLGLVGHQSHGLVNFWSLASWFSSMWHSNSTSISRRY